MSTVNEATKLEPVETESHPSGRRLNMLSGFRLVLDRTRIKDRYLIGIAIFLAVGFSVGAFSLYYFFDSKNLSSVGYLGVFVFTFLGAATIFLPSGGSAVVILAGAVLNPVLVGLLAGTAAALGELTGYAVGYEGGAFLEKRTKLYSQAKRWMEKRGSITIFLLSVFPNPLFDAAGLAAGGIRFPLRKFLALAWLGKTIQGLAGAFIGRLGSDWLVNLVARVFD